MSWRYRLELTFTQKTKGPTCVKYPWVSSLNNLKTPFKGTIHYLSCTATTYQSPGLHRQVTHSTRSGPESSDTGRERTGGTTDRDHATSVVPSVWRRSLGRALPLYLFERPAPPSPTTPSQPGPWEEYTLDTPGTEPLG